MKLNLIIITILICNTSLFCQDIQHFFPIVNPSIFNSEVIKEEGISNVIVKEYKIRNAQEIENLNIILYFDDNGNTNHLEIFEDGGITECFRREKLQVYFQNNKDISNMNYCKIWGSSEEEDVADSVKNVLIETCGCHIKQTYFKDRLPISVTWLNSPAYEDPLTTYYFYFEKNRKPLNLACLTKEEIAEIKQTELLLQDTMWKEEYITGSFFNDTLIDTRFLSTLKSFWDFFPNNIIDSSNFEVIGFKIIGTLHGYNAETLISGPIIKDDARNLILSSEAYSLQDIKLLDKRTNKNVDLSGFRKMIMK